MTESETPTGDVPNVSYMAITLARVGNRDMVCIVSTDAGQTHNHLATAEQARIIALQLKAHADVLDPGNPPFESISPRAQRDKAAATMVKRAARKKSGRKTRR